MRGLRGGGGLQVVRGLRGWDGLQVVRGLRGWDGLQAVRGLRGGAVCRLCVVYGVGRFAGCARSAGCERFRIPAFFRLQIPPGRCMCRNGGYERFVHNLSFVPGKSFTASNRS